MTTDERIAANYRALRQRMGITQPAAAEAARGEGFSLTKAWISAIENGRRPGSGQLDALGASIGIDPSVLTMPVPESGAGVQLVASG